MTTLGRQQRLADPATSFDVGGDATYLSHIYNANVQEQHRARDIPVDETQSFEPVDQTLPEQASLPTFNFQTQSMDINLLSSENYHQIFQEHGDPIEAEGPSSQSYGGSSTIDRQPGQQRTRTRTRRGSKKDSAKSSSQDDTARQRGRPRLDTKDQTAAERRRTQIRLAQRAYRQRKETTISGLNKRVLSLEKTIQDMHKTFLDFQDEVAAAGLRNWNPVLAGSLHRSAAAFTELAKNGVHESDAEGEDLATVRPEEGLEDGFGDILSNRDLRPQQAKNDSHPGQRRREPGANAGLGTDTIWGYSPTFEHLIVAPEVQDRPQDPAQSVEDAQMQNWEPSNADISSNQNIQLYQVQVPELSFYPDPPVLINAQTFFPMPSISSELPPPKTFTNTETSFARRLLRHSLEAAINLFSSPFSPQEEIDRFCRFTFCYTNRTSVLGALKQMVARTAKENLEFWQMPYYHHGGAGLHFPRVGIDATSDPPENWAEPGPIGPVFNYAPETGQFEGIERARIVEELGVDGEWFDSNDVEQYLRTKGIFLDGKSSVVEISEQDDDLPVPELGSGTATGYSAASPSNSHSSMSGPQSPQNDFVPSNAVIYGEEKLFNADPLSYDDVALDIGVDKLITQCKKNIGLPGDGTTCPTPGFDFNLFPQMSQSQNQRPLQTQIQPQILEQNSYFTLRKKKYVDVEKLIDSKPFAFIFSLSSSLAQIFSSLF